MASAPVLIGLELISIAMQLRLSSAFFGISEFAAKLIAGPVLILRLGRLVDRLFRGQFVM